MEKQILDSLVDIINTIEHDLIRIKTLIKKLQHGEQITPEEIQIDKSEITSYEEDGLKVLEGIYDGYFFIGPNDKKLPVPLNYASKSKLIPGDKLKVTIFSDGRLIYKLIKPAPRKYIKATVSKVDDNKYIAITDDGTTYKLNLAAVTYFKIKPGDEISLIINSEGKGEYGAIEGVISSLEDLP